jgi:cell division septation protein DedD
LGSFASAANADKLARTLRGKGIRVYVSAQGGKHRVRAGPFPDRPAADRAATKLKAQGQSVSIIAP